MPMRSDQPSVGRSSHCASDPGRIRPDVSSTSSRAICARLTTVPRLGVRLPLLSDPPVAALCGPSDPALVGVLVPPNLLLSHAGHPHLGTAGGANILNINHFQKRAAAFPIRSAQVRLVPVPVPVPMPVSARPLMAVGPRNISHIAAHPHLAVRIFRRPVGNIVRIILI